MPEGGAWRLLPRPIRRFPADLAAVVVLVVLTDVAVLAPVVSASPLRVVLGLPLVLFLPGYALVSALFPEAGTAPGEAGEAGEGSLTARAGIDGLERVALGFGLSIAVVPLIGLALNFTPWGIRLWPILVALNGFTVTMAAVAAIRRWALPVEDRFRVPYRVWLAAARREAVAPESRMDAALNVLVVASLLLAVASVTYAVAVPKQGEAFTEFYLLTRGPDGALVAADYPTELTLADDGSAPVVVVGIGNREHRAVTYTVVVELQAVEFVGDNATRVVDERELGRFSRRLADNETYHRDYAIRPTMPGQRLRLTFLLYADGAPPEPTVANAYRETHLWVNVTTDG